MNRPSPESLQLIHSLVKSKEFMTAMKEIFDDRAQGAVEATRGHLRAGMTLLAVKSEAETEAYESIPSILKFYAGKVKK